MKTHIAKANSIIHGDCIDVIPHIERDSIALSFWSPPYHVGKEYEIGQSFEEWRTMIFKVIALHHGCLKPGGFLVVNIADILCFPDSSLPRIQFANISQHRSFITKEQVVAAKNKHPDYNRNQLAKILGCSEQTIDRRLHGNNIRGGKYNTQTKVKLVGHYIEQAGVEAGLHLYDHRIWVKDPTWANSQWHSSSYRAVSEYEDLYVLWKPGETLVDRAKLRDSEWSEWGSRQVWYIRSVRKNNDHPAKYPEELATKVIRLYSFPDDTVLDPFLGSGTTAVAAIKNQRRYIGIEKMEKYFNIAEQNIAEAKHDLFYKK
jgi:site-specific DNA-methyltransferase (adenine-specific)